MKDFILMFDNISSLDVLIYRLLKIIKFLFLQVIISLLLSNLRLRIGPLPLFSDINTHAS